MLPGGLSLGRVGGPQEGCSHTSVHLWSLLRKCECVVSRLGIFIDFVIRGEVVYLLRVGWVVVPQTSSRKH